MRKSSVDDNARRVSGVIVRHDCCREIPNCLSAQVFSLRDRTWVYRPDKDSSSPFADRCLTGIALGQELQDDAIAEIGWRAEHVSAKQRVPFLRAASRLHNRATVEFPPSAATSMRDSKNSRCAVMYQFSLGSIRSRLFASKICAPSSRARDISSSSKRLRVPRFRRLPAM